MSPGMVARIAWGEVRLYARAAVSPLLARRDQRRQQKTIVEDAAAKVWAEHGPNGGAS